MKNISVDCINTVNSLRMENKFLLLDHKNRCPKIAIFLLYFA